MPSIFDLLLDIIHSRTLESWKERNEVALASLFGSRYAKRAEKAVTLRAPDMRGGDSGVPYAAYIHPSNPDTGAYGGMSFVIFPVEDEPCLVAMVIGTQGLAPDEAILGRPGHARKLQAVSHWLNHEFGGGDKSRGPSRIRPVSISTFLTRYNGCGQHTSEFSSGMVGSSMHYTGQPRIASARSLP